MEIGTALQTKKAELDSIQKDIDSLESQAVGLKDSVLKYNELKSKSAELKKTKKKVHNDMKIVLEFLDSADHSYVEKYFPLFADELKQKEQAAA